MPEADAVERGKRMALFVMLIMGAILHCYSVAYIYLPVLIYYARSVRALFGK